jgi:hypothetical protein
VGHYRSEMGFEDEDARRAERERRTRDMTAEAIMEAISKDGISYVLADIILDPTMAKIRYRKHG